MSALFLGLDGGGSWARAAVLDADARPCGRAAVRGASVAGGGAEQALAALAGAAHLALRGLDAEAVAGCVAGLAGYRALAEPAEFAERCRAAFGIPVPVRLCSDAVPAFAAGSTATAGTVLIAGTGAVCCRVADGRVTHYGGGFGWLLGDEGSGFWLGRAAVRRALDEPTGPLAAAVLRHCGAAGPVELLHWVYDGPPRRLAELAPLVGAAAEAGDPAAGAIVAEAAEHLAALVRATAQDGPLVLAGSVAAAAGPVRARLLALLADPRTGVAGPLHTAGDAALAAARLAMTPPPGADDPAVRSPELS
ncbi:N-acetylglucosamine kinase [Kitasatospora sp. LaBMicrA B282]|uniref:N-acetylglucosamine kinase n=1 Tax=Kitasatospora sp. LaBMicrA B282 TaxID=3420949 RepID=UPI003D1229DA